MARGGDEKNTGRTRKLTREDIESLEKEQEEREARRREQERLYQTLFDHAGTAVCLTDPDGSLLKVNLKFCALVGADADAILGKIRLPELFGSDVMRLYTDVRERVEHQKPDDDLMGRELFLTRPDGEDRIVEATFAFFPNSDKATLALFDVTEKRALERQIRVKDQYLTSLLRDSHDAIIGVDLDGTIRSWNRGAWVIFGFEPDEIVGESYVKVMPPDRDHETDFETILREIHRRGYINEEELVRVTKDGRRVILSATRTAVRDASGNVIGFSTLMRDITERKRMEQRLIQSERLSALGEMAAFLAHEIKNPLNSMVINLEVLKGRLRGLDPEQKERMEKYANILSGEIKRLDKVITSVLDLARPVSTAGYRETDLNQVVNGLVELFGPQAKRRDVEIVTDLQEPLPPIVGDSDQLKQAILNLVLNAVQAMNEGGRLDIKTSSDSDGATVIVRDTGGGVADEVRDRIFDPFFTTKDDGNGMGLSIVTRIVESHGGSIVLDTEKGKGTTFTLHFPLA